MDRHQFLQRSRPLVTSRRAALGAALAIPGLAHLTAASAKKRCSPCKRRTRGKCKKNKPDGTACPTGICPRGRCVTASRGFSTPGTFTFTAPRAGTVTIVAFGAGGGASGSGGTGGAGSGAGMNGVHTGGDGTVGMDINGIPGGDKGVSSTVLGPPGATFVPDEREGDGSVTLTITPA